MSSSAIYRYFASRDDLLTALIIESYESLGAALRAAVEPIPERAHRSRWLAACRAMRAWAVEHPHEFSLLYGSPVPDYVAPSDTIAPAGRAVDALVAVVRAAAADGSLTPPEHTDSAMVPECESQLTATADLLAPGVPPLAMARLFQNLSQLVGVISLELYGHLVGTLDPAGPFFELTIAEMAKLLGLSDSVGVEVDA